jgi:acetyl-CoA carboxylase biotin carboxylase subunit
MRSAREMGIETIAVYSDADRKSLHVRYADEAVCIGAAPSNQSYLLGNKIIEIAKQLKADAIHPGYGFLSENAVFARAVRNAGLLFVGPTPESMEIMGSKLGAKKAVKKFKVPMVPGTDKTITNIDEALIIAEQTGFPILIKASAGGGGKGMRIVHQKEDFTEQLKTAVSEAISAFGDGAVFMEKYVSSPRHIEIQIMADTHGNVVYLFERECSIQRRHQKLVEEAPSSVLTEKLRKEMGECAVNVAKACKYEGAGTVEFLLDENNNFYFLEMNTRLQVEHPVTEFITGIDLVKEQIKAAMGEKLSFGQQDLKINGHAIEIRVCAEDPMNNFLPDVGTLNIYKAPSGIGIRVDDGYEQGMDIPIFYDPMIAKLIVHGKNREEAIQRMIRAIDEYQITGISTTLSFCKFVMKHEAFISGEFDTHFVQKYFKPDVLENFSAENSKIAVLAVAKLMQENQIHQLHTPVPIEKLLISNWKRKRLES